VKSGETNSAGRLRISQASGPTAECSKPRTFSHQLQSLVPSNLDDLRLDQPMGPRDGLLSAIDRERTAWVRARSVLAPVTVHSTLMTWPASLPQVARVVGNPCQEYRYALPVGGSANTGPPLLVRVSITNRLPVRQPGYRGAGLGALRSGPSR
jgi:hypothetical protein